MIKDLFGIRITVSVNPSNYECEWDVGEYLDYKNCKRRKKLVDKLTEESIENVEEVKIAKITLVED